jgi:PncC family amidohydrolase
MKELVQLLIDKKKTIATMESCTGGGVSNAITNIEGASEILKFSAVTYSNEYKIKMGVSEEVINKYSVYSEECSIEMSKNISMFAGSDFGVGITGKLNRVDINNPFGKDNVVFISIYDKENDKFYNESIEATLGSRLENKELVIKKIIAMMKDILK